MSFLRKQRINSESLPFKKAVFSILILLVLGSGIYLWGRGAASSLETPAGPATASSPVVSLELSIQKGRSLAAQHCQSCHQLPDPALLDKNHWQKALAMMGPRLGIFYHREEAYPIYTDIDQNVYPGKPAMSESDWQHILDYYTAAAPAALPAQQKPVPLKKQLPFSIQLPSSLFYRSGNTTSFIKIDTGVKPHRLFVNRSTSNTLYVLNHKLQLLDSMQTDGPLVDIDFNGNALVAAKMGRNLFGDNARNGSLMQLQVSRQGRIQPVPTILFDTLARPLQVLQADLNKDQQIDYLICEFGNMYGSLVWMENKGQGKFQRHDIRAVAGATKAFLQDHNKDGLPDIWVQFSQAEEGVFLFTNKGNGAFEQKQVLRFPASYGSSSFELVDFNHDGFPDMVYTCGDRGDGINQLKPYQGVYILMNNGRNEFAIKYFYPINGCMKALARDFDKDGDLDLAAIGFFTDNRQPEEGFTYLENKGNWNFQPYSLPVPTSFTKATTMDVADLDGDNKLDIVLGHGFLGDKAMDHKKPLFLVLKNRF